MYVYVYGFLLQLSPSKEKEGQAGPQVTKCFGSAASARNIKLWVQKLSLHQDHETIPNRSPPIFLHLPVLNLLKL